MHFIALHICSAFNTFSSLLKSVKYFEKANLDFRVISNIDLNSYSFLLQNISKLEIFLKVEKIESQNFRSGLSRTSDILPEIVKRWKVVAVLSEPKVPKGSCSF